MDHRAYDRAVRRLTAHTADLDHYQAMRHQLVESVPTPDQDRYLAVLRRCIAHTDRFVQEAVEDAYHALHAGQ